MVNRQSFSPRLRHLNRAIEQNPDAAVNFVLRGEYWLALGVYTNAIQDFEDAIVLARQEWTFSEWGYLFQAMIDRAEQGLRLAREYSL
jgi:tetratricopeptide (TPR) repeat protein